MTMAITFTNTNTAQQTSPSRVVSQTHKRSAHSISAVPLAQPPTSPRSPRTVLPVTVTRKPGESDVVERKGLVGRSERRARNSNRSLSLDMTFKANGELSPQQETSSPPSKTPIHVQRALGTTTSAPNHRCSRKQRTDLPLQPPHHHASHHLSQDLHHFLSPPNIPMLANNQYLMVNSRSLKMYPPPLPLPTFHSPSPLIPYPRVRPGQVHPLLGQLPHPQLPERHPALAYRSVRCIRVSAAIRHIGHYCGRVLLTTLDAADRQCKIPSSLRCRAPPPRQRPSTRITVRQTIGRQYCTHMSNLLGVWPSPLWPVRRMPNKRMP